MSVFVDNARIPARVGRHTSQWSHLTADTREELHVFAERLGLRRSYFQTCKSKAFCKTAEECVHWHYDVTAPKRANALRLGAVEMDLRQWADLTRARRAALASTGGTDG